VIFVNTGLAALVIEIRMTKQTDRNNDQNKKERKKERKKGRKKKGTFLLINAPILKENYRICECQGR